jgi:hypothetical protein
LGNKTSHFGKLYLTKHPTKGGKGRAKKEKPSPNQKLKNPKWVSKGKGTNYVPKPPPPITKSISKRENEI